jgi:hypothetical protein
MIPLLKLPARGVYYLPRTTPAVFYLADTISTRSRAVTGQALDAQSASNSRKPWNRHNPAPPFAPRGFIRVDSLNRHRYTQFTD